jgi:hypothetical protein
VISLKIRNDRAGSTGESAKSKCGTSSSLSDNIGNESVTSGVGTISDSSLNNVGIPVPVSSNLLGGGEIVVLGGAEADKEGLHRPLKLGELELSLINGKSSVVVAMDADQRETNAGNVNVMNIGENEDVVDVKISASESGDTAASSLNNGISSATTLTREESNVTAINGAKHLLDGSEINIDETLTLGNGDGSDGKADILVEPEHKRNEHLELALSGLGSLGTIGKGNGGSPGVVSGSGLIKVSLISDLLTHAALVGSELVGLDGILALSSVGVREILIKGVTVDLNLGPLEETLSGVVAITKSRGVGSRRAGSSPRSRSSPDLIQHNVKTHVAEEIAELGNVILDARAILGVTRSGLDAVILEPNRRERLEMGINEEKMGLLDIHKGRVGILGPSLSLANGGQTLLEERRSHDKPILLTIISNNSENRTGRHFKTI